MSRKGLVGEASVGHVLKFEYYGRIYNLTGATTDWLETYQRGQLVLEQASRMAPSFPEAAQAELQCWISSEQQLRAVYE